MFPFLLNETEQRKGDVPPFPLFSETRKTRKNLEEENAKKKVTRLFSIVRHDCFPFVFCNGEIGEWSKQAKRKKGGMPHFSGTGAEEKREKGRAESGGHLPNRPCFKQPREGDLGSSESLFLRHVHENHLLA